MTAVLLLLLSQFPSASATAWMEPAAFRLVLGDSRSGVEQAFSERDWELDEGDEGNLIHDYADGKTVTMEFRETRLTSVRFELVTMLPGLDENWEELVAHLRDRFGEPDISSSSLFLLRTPAMTIHAVLDNRLDSDLGSQGAGRIIVRYFVPPSTATGSRDTSR